MTLLICRTCPRYDCRSTGQFGRELAAAITAAGVDLPVRNVQCLGGCPDDGVAAVDGPGLVRVRFTGLTSDDAPAIIKAALAHQASDTGSPGDWAVPDELADRISAITTKRGVTGQPGPPRPATPAPWPGQRNNSPGFTSSYRGGFPVRPPRTASPIVLRPVPVRRHPG
jgi:predicted metal-binding protein